MFANLFDTRADQRAFARWRRASRAAARSPNYRRPWVLADHPALAVLLRDNSDVFRGWLTADWLAWECDFWGRWPESSAGELDLAFRLAVKIAAEVAGRRV